MRTAKTLIRLGGCPGCSDSSLGAHAILLVLSRCGSNDETPYHNKWYFQNCTLIIGAYLFKVLFMFRENDIKHFLLTLETASCNYDGSLLQ